MSDGAIALLTVGLIALCGAGALAWTWLEGRQPQTPLEQALERQGQGLVVDPQEFRVNSPGGIEGNPECQPGQRTLLAVDIADGAEIWRTQIPSSDFIHFGGMPTIEDTEGRTLALAIDARLGDLPPSVMAIDVDTGKPRWQRFIAADFLRPIGVGDEHLAMIIDYEELDEQANAVDVIYQQEQLDGAGQLLGGAVISVNTWPRFEASMLGPGFRHLETDLGGEGPQPIIDGDVEVPIEVYDPDDATSTVLNAVPYDETFHYLGSESSPGLPVQISQEHVLAVLGSSLGPNTRLAVFDRTGGSLLWTLDHTRAAALAGSDVLYDKRNAEPLDAASTRDLFLVDADDPERLRWSTRLAVNDRGGNGFLGVVDGALIFAVSEDALGLDFLSISGPGEVPEIIAAAAGGYGSGPSLAHHVDADVMAAATEAGVVVKPAGQEAILISTDLPPVQVTRVGDRLLVATNLDDVNEDCW